MKLTEDICYNGKWHYINSEDPRPPKKVEPAQEAPKPKQTSKKGDK